jgi:hypothetical protein
MVLLQVRRLSGRIYCPHHLFGEVITSRWLESPPERLAISGYDRSLNENDAIFSSSSLCLNHWIRAFVKRCCPWTIENSWCLYSNLPLLQNSKTGVRQQAHYDRLAHGWILMKVAPFSPGIVANCNSFVLLDFLAPGHGLERESEIWILSCSPD